VGLQDYFDCFITLCYIGNGDIDMAMDFSFIGGTGADGSYKFNPNFQQLLAGMGSGFGKGQSAGQAIGDPASQMIRAIALQGGNPQMAEPTPKGQEGPDQVQETITRTADGTTKVTKVVEPSKKNLSTYGPNMPVESMAQKLAPQGQGGVSEQSPFWKALLGQVA
jgi:hypothetical protein